MIPTLTLLPPDLFPPAIQPLLYFTLMPLALILGLVFVLGAWFIWFPPEARLYIMNKLWKKTMFDVETESGVRFLDTGKVLPEGIIVLDRSKLKLLIGRPVSNDRVATELASLNNGKVSMKQLAKVIDKIREAERVTLKPSIVKGLGVRMYRVYQSFGVATSMANLVGLGYEGNSTTTPLAVPILAKNNKVISPAKLFIEKGKELSHWIVNVALPVDPAIVKIWSHLEVSPVQQDKLVWLGKQWAKIMEGNKLSKWLPYIILIVFIVIAAGVAIIFLGGGGVEQVTPPVNGGGV